MVNKNKTTRNTRKKRLTAEEYSKQVEKRSIKKSVKKGITTSEIKNLLGATQTEVNQHSKRLLEPIIKDKEMLELVATPENMSKMKHRLEHRIKVKDLTGRVLLTTHIMNKTTEKAIMDIKTAIQDEGQEIDGKSPHIIDNLKEKGWLNIKKETDGIIATVELTTIFRKGN